MASTVLTAESVAPLRQRQNLEFPYKHSTGATIGRFLAGLKEQKKIWGQRVSGQGVVVPPLGYSEIDASEAGEWVEVKDTGVITAAARVDDPIDRLHPSTTPFAFMLVQLDGADTALAHFVKDDLDRVAVGARVEAVWAADDARIGHLRDIVCFRVIADAPPKAKPAVKAPPAPKPAAKTAPRRPAKGAGAKARKGRKTKVAAKPAKRPKPAKAKTTAKAATKARTVKPAKPTKAKKKPAAAQQRRKAARAKVVKPARAKTRKAGKPVRAKKPAKRTKKPAKKVRAKGQKRKLRR